MVIGRRGLAHVDARWLLVLPVAFGLAANWTIAERCGGTERWFVKSGTDSDADQVDVASPVDTTVQGLNSLPKLHSSVPAGNNTMRLTAERKVYSVHGRLVKFKNEEDQDYHLVITDDSLQYTPGGPGTAGMETGTSFIAEIPDPLCVAGKHGTLGADSTFQAQLVSTRAKFEQRFPGGKGADTNLGGIPVTLVGIAFYDRQHLQTGRAVNGIELHPLLEITFEDQVPTPGITAAVAGLTQILENPGFESGPTGWSGSTSDIGSYEDQSARGGSQIAWMGGRGIETSENLRQNATIPSTATQAKLTLWLNIQSEETTNSRRYDFLYVDIRHPDGSPWKALGNFTNLDETANYGLRTFDVSEFIGKEVQIRFTCREDAEKATSFVLDDLALVVQ